jgi:hypothetical protein
MLKEYKLENKTIPNCNTAILISSDYNYNNDMLYFINHHCIVLNMLNKSNISEINDKDLLKYNIYDLKDKKILTKIDELKINIVSNITNNKNNEVFIFFNVLTYLDDEFKNKVINELNNNHKRIINYTSEIEEVLLFDYLIVEDKEKVIMEGKTNQVLKEEKILKKLGFDLPFIIELSNGLKYYELVDETYYNNESLVEDLWK